MEKLKVLELFGGIGACSKALERLGVPHEIVDYVEIDKYAVASFNAIHGTNFDVQDICTWDKDISVDLIMHGSPCQDFSLAGKQRGGDKDSGTRSSLMYETLRIVEKLKPKYVIWENVKNLLSKKHRHNFDAYLEAMEGLGYTNYYQVLNAKDYGIPQNRERVFTVSILENESYKFPEKEKLNKMPIDVLEDDIDEKYYLNEKNLEWLKEHNKNHEEKGTGFIFKPKDPTNEVANTIRANASWCPTDNAFYEFPPKQELKLKLKDMLEDEVDEKYYISREYVEFNNFYTIPRGSDGKLINGSYNRVWKDDRYCGSINLTKVQEVGTLNIKGYDCIKRVYSDNGLSPTLTDMQGGNRQPKVLIKNATKKGYLEAYDGDGVNISSRMKYQRGNVQSESVPTLTTAGGNDVGVVLKSKCKRLNELVKNTHFEEGKVLNMDLYNQTTNENISQCLTEPHHNSQRLFDGLRIRKLTPKECWRLMGFDDEDFEKAEKVNSNTQLYKQAGNSIVVNVLEAILKNLLCK